jgi:hypothetical protein
VEYPEEPGRFIVDTCSRDSYPPSCTVHSFTVRPPPPEARSLPSGEKATDMTQSV